MYPFVVHVEYWNNSEISWKKKNTDILIYASNFTEAIKIVEEYVDMIDSISIDCVGDNFTLFEVPEEIAKKFIEKEGNIR